MQMKSKISLKSGIWPGMTLDLVTKNASKYNYIIKYILIINLKRHSVVQISLFFKKSKFTLSKLPKNIDEEKVWSMDKQKEKI